MKGCFVYSVACVLLLAMASPAMAEEETLVDYTVAPGDTCLSIAKRVLGSPQHYRVLHQHNPWLGPTPHNLQPGTILKVPARLLNRNKDMAPDAVLTGKRGPVRVRKPTEAEWDKARLGMDLYRAWRVSSRERASAELTFRDESKIHMRDNTLVIIYGPSASQGRAITTQAELEQGTLRARLHELGGSPKLLVKTPSSESSLGKTNALVSVDGGGISRVANHAGGDIEVRGTGPANARKVKVTVGYGSKVKRDTAPQAPRKLPPTPAWTEVPALAAALPGQGGTIRGAWAPVATAVSYRIEIARNPDGSDVVAAVTAPGNASSFEAHQLPLGAYYVTVAAIDGDSFESIPSEQREIRVASLGLSMPGAGTQSAASAGAAGSQSGGQPPHTQPSGPLDSEVALEAKLAAGSEDDEEAPLDVATAAPAPVMLPGTRVAAPDGAACTAGPGWPTAEVILREPGRMPLECVDAQGRKLAPVAVMVADLRAQVVNSAGTGPLPRQASTTLDIRLESDAQARFPDQALVLEGPPGVAVQVIERAADGRLRVAVTPGADAPDTIELVVLARSGDRRVRLAAVAVPVQARIVAEPGQQPAAPSAPPPAHTELGAFAGASAYSDDYDLGDIGDTGVALAAGTVAGLRGTYMARPSLGIELELGAARTSVAMAEGSAMVLGGRAHLVLATPAGNRLTAFVLAGAGAQLLAGDTAGMRTDVDADVHYGAGIKWLLGPRLGIRLDGRHVFAPARTSTLTSLYELNVGIFARFGSLLD